MCCGHGDGRCLDFPNMVCTKADDPTAVKIPIVPVEGKPGLYKDTDSNQLFKTVDTGKGIHKKKRLVPTYKKRVNYKKLEGYLAVRLMLACLACETPAERFVLWNDTTDEEMTPKEWCKRKFTARSTPPVKHLKCGTVTTTTRINSLANGCGIGCTACVDHMNPWVNRYDRAHELIDKAGGILDMTRDEWKEQCKNCDFKPRIKCKACGTVVTTTKINSLDQGHGIGCTKCVAIMNLWVHRYDEFCAEAKKRGVTVLTTKAVWEANCKDCHFKPKCQCDKCMDVFDSTSIANMLDNNAVGCTGCHNKTEAKLVEELPKLFPTATAITSQVLTDRGNKNSMKLDYKLEFDDGAVILELDGPQHFRLGHCFFDEAGCQRDLLKEQWAIAKGISVVRLLQSDVWDDKHDWRGYLKKAVACALSSATPIVLTPDAPEYTRKDSAYAIRRADPTRTSFGCRFDVTIAS